jgi:hypothetical protein
VCPCAGCRRHHTGSAVLTDLRSAGFCRSPAHSIRHSPCSRWQSFPQ